MLLLQIVASARNGLNQIGVNSYRIYTQRIHLACRRQLSVLFGENIGNLRSVAPPSQPAALRNEGRPRRAAYSGSKGLAAELVPTATTAGGLGERSNSPLPPCEGEPADHRVRGASAHAHSVAVPKNTRIQRSIPHRRTACGGSRQFRGTQLRRYFESSTELSSTDDRRGTLRRRRASGNLRVRRGHEPTRCRIDGAGRNAFSAPEDRGLTSPCGRNL